jgi:hypothetical protein
VPITPPATVQVYPSIEEVLNLARTYLNDTVNNGAGLIFTDDQPFILPLINSAIATYQRDLWNRSVPTMIREVFFNSVPPINSANGVGVPNPAVWQVLGYTGFNDGLNFTTTPALPSDLLVPLKLWYRSSNTDLTFSEVNETANGLQTLYQEGSLGDWEWQGDQIVWNGSINATDVRLRYLGTVTYYQDTTPPSAFPTTYIPFRDSVQALAYRVAYDFAASRTQPGGANDLLAQYQSTINGVVQRQVRRQQHVNYARDPYGSTGDIFGWFG